MNTGSPGVVFDCNVFLQALANDESPAAKALDFLEAGVITWFVSEPVLREVFDVLTRPKLRRQMPQLTDVRVSALLQRLSNKAALIQNVPEEFQYPRDPKDEMYLNLAIVTNAIYLVSRDKDLLDSLSGKCAASASAAMNLTKPSLNQIVSMRGASSKLNGRYPVA